MLTIDTIHTFGETLHQLLRLKKISIVKLGNIMKYKSKNVVIRILRDQSSIKQINIFLDRLIRVINLTDDEINLLTNSIEVNMVGKETYLSRKIILNAIKFEPINMLLNFNKYVNCNKLEIIVFNLTNYSLAVELLSLLSIKESQCFSIRHYINYNNSKIDNSINFLLIY